MSRNYSLSFGPDIGEQLRNSTRARGGEAEAKGSMVMLRIMRAVAGSAQSPVPRFRCAHDSACTT